MRLLAGYTAAEVGLGHLIQQSAGSAQRGAWRGSGFEATTQGWASVRAAKGLLVSTTARAGSYGSAQSTQMDAAEALALLKGGNDLGKRLGDAAKAATAQPLASFESGQSVEKLLEQIDPKKLGKHQGSVNGQEAKKANGRTLSDPVEAFASPVIVLDTPSTAAFATEAGIASFAGQDTSLAVQGDAHQAAAHTWASVSGKTTSWYVHEGGVKAFAANGAVSLRAHTDALQILADKDVTVISVNDEIRISAQTKIEIIAGQSSITLEGSNIEFKTPGAFTVKGSGHAFLGGSSGAVSAQALPAGLLADATAVVGGDYLRTPVEQLPAVAASAAAPVKRGTPSADAKAPGAAVDKVIDTCPMFRASMDNFKTSKVTVVYGTAGGGSFLERGPPPKITIDSAERGNTNAVTQTLAHELGHAEYSPPPFSPPIKGTSKAAFVDRSALEGLKDEARAVKRNIELQRCVKVGKGGDIGVAGANAKTYEAVFDKYPDSKDEGKMIDEIANAFGTEHPSTAPTSTYKDYYGKPYADWWDKNVKRDPY